MRANEKVQGRGRRGFCPGYRPVIGGLIEWLSYALGPEETFFTSEACCDGVVFFPGFRTYVGARFIHASDVQAGLQRTSGWFGVALKLWCPQKIRGWRLLAWSQAPAAVVAGSERASCVVCALHMVFSSVGCGCSSLSSAPPGPHPPLRLARRTTGSHRRGPSCGTLCADSSCATLRGIKAGRGLV